MNDNLNIVPEVSVCMITYNHEEFIAQAIEGVMMQQTNFPFELVIGEDYGTDNTINICREYQTRYPDKIRVLDRGRNLGMMPNSLDTLIQCRAKLIAICEGDDYWIDPLKLQKQYDHIVNNNLTLSFHDGIIAYQNDVREEQRHIPLDIESGIYTVRDILKLGPLTSSMMFAKKDFFPIPSFYNTTISGDHMIQILLALKGKIDCIREVMSVYRQHAGGITTLMNGRKWLNNRIFVAKELLKNTNSPNRNYLKSHIHDLYISMAIKYRNSRIDGFLLLLKAIFSYPLGLIRETKLHLYYFKQILTKNINHES